MNPLFLGTVGAPEALIILGILLVVWWAPKKIPEMARGFGQGLVELKRGLKWTPDDGKKEDTSPKRRARK